LHRFLFRCSRFVEELLLQVLHRKRLGNFSRRLQHVPGCGPLRCVPRDCCTPADDGGTNDCKVVHDDDDDVHNNNNNNNNNYHDAVSGRRRWIHSFCTTGDRVDHASSDHTAVDDAELSGRTAADGDHGDVVLGAERVFGLYDQRHDTRLSVRREHLRPRVSEPTSLNDARSPRDAVRRAR
jgi:hypothetical protein